MSDDGDVRRAEGGWPLGCAPRPRQARRLGGPPWEGDTVAKVGDKIFAFLGDESIGVKCAAPEPRPTSGCAATPTTRPSWPTSAATAGTPCASTGRSPTTSCSRRSTTSYELVVATLPKSKRPPA